MSLDWVTNLNPEIFDAEIAEREWQDEMSANGFLNPDEPALPSCCDRCGIKFGPVKTVEVYDQFGLTEPHTIGALLIGSRWVCPTCENPEYEDYFTSEADLLALHQDNQFESQREEAF